jgi:Flp pilus assembly CpaE family ATPase
MKKVCVVCGAEFEAGTRIKKYCSVKCSNKAKAQRTEEKEKKIQEKKLNNEIKNKKKIEEHNKKILAETKKLMSDFYRINNIKYERY